MQSKEIIMWMKIIRVSYLKSSILIIFKEKLNSRKIVKRHKKNLIKNKQKLISRIEIKN